MATDILEHGGLTVTRVAMRCDACGQVTRAYQFTGQHGYVTICFVCIRFAAANIASAELTAWSGRRPLIARKGEDS